MRIENLPDGMFQKVHFLEVTDSTNDYLKQFVEQGKPLIAQAGEQRAGRGRQNRQWLSPRNQGLYISFLFYPQWFSGLSPILNAVGVLAVLKSLRSLLALGLAFSLAVVGGILLCHCWWAFPLALSFPRRLC